MKLVIIEAPGKIKSVQKALSADNLFHDFEVFATSGQIYDTDRRNLDFDFINFKENKMVRNSYLSGMLKSKVKSSDCVYIMTDNDEMGEQIARDVVEFTEISSENYRRVRIGSMNPEEIRHSILNSKKNTIDYDMVSSSDARRIFNKIIGFGIIKRNDGISKGALYGSISTPVLSEILKKKTIVGNFKHSVVHKNEALPLKTIIPFNREAFNNEKSINIFFKEVELRVNEICLNSEKVNKYITNMDIYDGIKSVSFALNIDIKKSEKLLQDSYQNGKISYFRTSSKEMPKYNNNDFLELGKKYEALESSQVFESDLDSLENSFLKNVDPHPCIHPTSLDNNINDDLDFISDYNLAGAILARKFNLINSIFSTDKVFIRFPLNEKEKNKLNAWGLKVDDYIEYSLCLHTLKKNGINKIYDEDICPYDFISKGEYRKYNLNKLEYKLNTPEFIAFDIMYNNNIGKPSTWGYLSNKIGSFFNEKISPNGLAKSGYLIAKDNIPTLLDIENAKFIERIFSDKSLSTKEKVVNSLRILGLDYYRIGELQYNNKEDYSFVNKKQKEENLKI